MSEDICHDYTNCKLDYHVIELKELTMYSLLPKGGDK